MSNPIFGIQRILTLESPKVESIAYSVAGDPNDIRVFAAMKGGRLFEYFVRAESRNEMHKNRTYFVSNTISTVASKKKITKILPIQSMSKVFILSNGAISAFDFATLSPVFCNIPHTNVLDMGVHLTSETSIPFFWVLIKKRVFLYQYVQGQFKQYQEIPLNDTPLVMSWYEEVLLLQFKDRVITISIHTGQQINEFKTQVKNVAQMSMKLLQTKSILVSSSPSSYSSISCTSGCLAEKYSIQLSSAVKRVCYSTPFIFVLSDTLQVYDEYDGKFIESIPLPSPFQLLCDPEFTLSELKEELYSVVIGVSNEGDVMIVDMVDSDIYVNELLDTNRVLPAFSILHRNERIKNTLIDQEESHQKAFLFFFTQLNFSEAFLHASAAKIHPYEFLPLFPDLVCGSIPSAVLLTKEIIGRNNHTMTEFIVSILKQQSSNPSSITNDCEEVKKNYEISRLKLLNYLMDWHGSHELDLVIDTAIVHLLLQYEPLRVPSFLSAPTACEEQHIQPLLTEKGLFSVLASFYIQKQEPEKALTIWKDITEGKLNEEGVDGIQLISKYLRNSSSPSTIQLIQQFGSFIFEHSVDEAYKVFTLSEVSTDSIHDFILGLFDTLPDEKRKLYRTKYVKYLVMMTHLEEPMLNTEYLQILLAELEACTAENNADFNCVKLEDTPAVIKDKRMEFYTVLKSNQYYDAQVLLDTIGEKPLWFERIVLLSKLNRFAEAISIVINELKSIKFACECCSKFATLEGSKDNDPWKILLEILFKENDEEKKQAFREAGLQILENYAYEIDPLMVLSILPNDISNMEVLNYYQSIIPHSTNLMREARIQVGMKQVFLNDNLERLEEIKNTFTVIEGDQRCAICGEQLTNEEPTVLTRGRERVHEKCVSEEEKQYMIVLNDLYYSCLL